MCLNRSIWALQVLAVAGAIGVVRGFSVVGYQVRSLRRGPCGWAGYIGPEHFGRQNLYHGPLVGAADRTAGPCGRLFCQD